ncbi:hydrogenase-2 assembly chaperone [Enterobacter sp. Bisph1]|uniref:hydrogenase-2 assembly chaperone n=1 Tax=Enterobacter sp. Bisph1 TaxID=1274399 RepID=UPI00057BDAE2|nr:hydrogenase-2 assembly chaperone [Enterobacter sp. Bisph1]
MQNELAGFELSPHGAVQTAFISVAANEMHDLPFLHPAMPVYVTPFTLFEGQWLGCVLTPWMLSLQIYPGPQQCWPRRRVGERLGLQLPYGEIAFTIGELPSLGQYLSCSLMSPVDRGLTADAALALANNCLKMALSLPVADAAISRRGLLQGVRSRLHA